jgi:hypothetical protein
MSRIAPTWGEVDGRRESNKGNVDKYPLWQTWYDSSVPGQSTKIQEGVALLHTIVIHIHITIHLLLFAPVQICVFKS